MVRAKFKITKLERNHTTVPLRDADGKAVVDEQGRQKWGEGELVSIYASPVFGNGDPDHENTKFWTASPSGQLMLGTVNEAAAAYFELGKEYYLDFTRAG